MCVFICRDSVFTAGLLLLSTSLITAEPHTVYVADNALGVIYGYSSEEPGAEPWFVSGASSFEFTSYRQFGNNQAIFIPADTTRVALHDQEKNTVSLIYEAPENYFVTLVDAGPGENECSVVLRRVSGFHSSRIMEGRRESTDDPFTFTQGPWAFDDCWSAAPASVLHLGDHNYVLQITATSTDCPPSGFLLYGPEPGAWQVLHAGTTASSSIIRGPNESFMILEGTTHATKITAYTNEGEALQQAVWPFEEENIANLSISASTWNAGDPAFATITRSGVYTGVSPLDEEQTSPEQIFPFFDEEGNSRIEENFFGPGMIQRLGPIDCILASEILNSVGRLKVGNNNLEREFIHVRGGGPPFEDILALTVAPDGNLYAIDRGMESTRLMRITPLCGTREVVYEAGEGTHLPFLLAAEDGDLVFLRVMHQQASVLQSLSFNTSTKQVAVLAEGPYEPVAEPWTVTLLPGKEVKVRYPGVMNHALALSAGGTFEPLPRSVPLGKESFGHVGFPQNRMIWTGAFTLTEELAASDEMRILLSIPREFDGYPAYEFYLTDPAGVTKQVSITGFQRCAGFPLICDAMIVIESDGFPEGEWGFEAKLGYSTAEPVDWKAQLLSAPQCTAEVGRDSGSLIVTFNPTRLIQVDDMTDSVVSRIDVTNFPAHPAGRSVMAGETLYVSERNGFGVWRIDTETGAATVFAETRPDSLGAELTGESVFDAAVLAIGPMLEPSDVEARWVFY